MFTAAEISLVFFYRTRAPFRAQNELEILWGTKQSSSESLNDPHFSWLLYIHPYRAGAQQLI